MDNNMRRLLVIGALMLACGQASAQGKIDPSAYGDRVLVTDDRPLIGFQGMQTSCTKLAMLGSDLPGALDGILYDGMHKQLEQYNNSQGLFGVPFVKWTPETVLFLKNKIDQCVVDANPLHRLLNAFVGGSRAGLSMSPQMAKDVLDQIYAIASVTNERAVQAVEVQRVEADQQAAQQQALIEHIARLKSGKDKVANTNDAIYLYSPKSIESIISSPLLAPDNGYYAGRVILDYQQNKNVLRAKIENYIDLSSVPPRLISIGYVFLKNKNAKVFDPSLMRLGSGVRVVGKYVSNVDYETVSGETKTSPVLEVMFFGK